MLNCIKKGAAAGVTKVPIRETDSKAAHALFEQLLNQHARD
jgi:hypothetical protein